MKRRDLLKGFATVPVLGAFAYAWYKKRNYERYLKKNILEEIQLKATAPHIPESGPMDKQIRLGLIGYGIRGKQLARAAGFAHPELIDSWIQNASEDSSDTRYRDYLEQEDLNLVVNGVCDIFDTYGRMAREAAANINREGSGGKMGPLPKRYQNYLELINAKDIDAVIIDDVAGQGYVGENADKVKLVGDSLSSDYLGFIYPKGSDLVAPVDKALQSMMDDGFLTQLNKKYFGPDFTMTYDDIGPGAYGEDE